MTFFDLRHPRWQRTFVVALLVFGIIIAKGVSDLSLSPDARVYFSAKNPAYKQLLDFEGIYRPSTKLLVVLHRKGRTLLDGEGVTILRELTDAFWSLPYSIRVESAVNAPYISSAGDTISIKEMDASGSAHAAGIADRILDDELIVGKFISPDGRTAALSVSFDYSSAEAPIATELIYSVNEMIRGANLERADIDYWLGGRVALSDAFARAARSDLVSLNPMSYATITLLLALFLRSLLYAVTIMTIGLLASFVAMGFAGHMGYQINSSTACAPSIIVALCVANLIHTFDAMIGQRSSGTSQSAALALAIGRTWKPLLVTIATTVTGFLTLNFADAPPFRHLGNIVAVGCCTCGLLAIFALPIFLRAFQSHPARVLVLNHRMISRWAARVYEFRFQLSFLAASVFAALLSGLFQLSVDDDFSEYLDQSYRYRRDVEKIEAHLTGTDIVDIDLASAPGEKVTYPSYLSVVQEFTLWAIAWPKVSRVDSVAPLLERIHFHLHDGRGSGSLPDDPTAIAQYLLLYELSLPRGHDLTETLTPRHDHSRITVTLRDASSSEIIAFKNACEEWFSARDSGRVATVTGLSVVYAHLTEINVQSMIGGSFVALTLISTMLFLCFRSIYLGVVSLVPNLLPTALALGTWSHLQLDIGAAVSVVGVVTLGIIVDDTVHMIWRYREARLAGATKADSVERMFASTSRPMLFSSVALICGFLVISTSGFWITSSMGILSAATLFFALMADWLLLPALLSKW